MEKARKFEKDYWDGQKIWLWDINIFKASNTYSKKINQKL